MAVPSMSGQFDNRDWTRTASYEMYSMQPTELIGKFLHDRVGAEPDKVALTDALRATKALES